LGPIDGACAPWPALLVLDRPEQGLNAEGLRALMRRVSTSVDALGAAVLLHTDDARLADMADTVVNLDRQHVCGRSSALGRLWH
jgi:ABC-type Mn2+/Zn2+ transport system ATPase subunit